MIVCLGQVSIRAEEHKTGSRDVICLASLAWSATREPYRRGLVKLPKFYITTDGLVTNSTDPVPGEVDSLSIQCHRCRSSFRKDSNN